MPTEFKNEPFTDFSDPANRQAQADAIKKVEAELGKTYPLILAGKEVTVAETFDSFNPSRKEQLVGRFQSATTREVQLAVQAGLDAFPAWSARPVQERADILFKGAALMRAVGGAGVCRAP